MPVYYKENPEYLSEALDSIFNQTVKPDEVVLIEDGKLGEQLEETVKAYEKKHKNLHVIRNKENRGLGPALHDGILECKNKIIFRMDADDIAVEDRFEKQLKAFAETDSDVVGSNIAEYDVTMQEVTGERHVPEKHEDIAKQLKTKNPTNHMSVAFKKSHVLKAGNYQPMPGFEDYYLWARMIKNGSKFYNVQENLIKVRGGSSLMKRRGGRAYLKSIKNFEKALLNLGLIDFTTYLKNVQIRSIVCISPNGLRRVFYKKALRK